MVVASGCLFLVKKIDFGGFIVIKRVCKEYGIEVIFNFIKGYEEVFRFNSLDGYVMELHVSELFAEAIFIRLLVFKGRKAAAGRAA